MQNGVQNSFRYKLVNTHNESDESAAEKPNVTRNLSLKTASSNHFSFAVLFSR